jgi:hypothetical protein
MALGALFPRMLRAAKVESQLYEEVEADSGATGQALLVVVMASLSAGLGHGISGLIKGGAGGSGFFFANLITGAIGSLIAWFIFSLLCYWLGTTLFKGPDTKSTLGELLRVLGFADSPALLNIFAFVPFIGPIIPFVTMIWTIIAGVVGVRQACDFTTGRAVGTVVVASIIPLIILMLIGVAVGVALAAMMK